ncbi:MAG: serine/threonine protein kinase [Myxococcales bacterium]|nr:serine/threonine protein kinase [Myxococcales bacterium]
MGEADSAAITAAATATEAQSGSRVEAEPERGAVIGRYVVLSRLGAGGMGVVYAAVDPDLDRKVALKLVRARTADAGARLLREAQALAKLSHPNVVAIHDVGVHGAEVWLAMEFVAGRTLEAWAKEQPRRWPEVVAVLADVARGVVAAHAAGLVHRDLKPDNVMIGDDGRVRVMDFGLAHGRPTSGESMRAPLAPIDEVGLLATLAPASASAALAAVLTRVGAIQGTPAYMAPEQWRGEEAPAATDQFGWCVVAWELLHGERPFAGESLTELATAVTAGERRPPPRGSRVPAWLRRIVARGLAVDPSERWPSMAALLQALERGRGAARARTGAAVVGAVALLAGGLAGVQAWRHARAVAACEAAGASIESTWDAAAGEALRAGFTGTGVSYAAAAADKTVPLLDAAARAWRADRTAACMRIEVEGAWSQGTAERALWCLEDRRTELAATIAELLRADRRIVPQAVPSASSLTPTSTCLDPARLALLPPVPPLERRAEAAALRGVRWQALALKQSGRYDEALALILASKPRAEAIEMPAMVAALAHNEGTLLERKGDYKLAEAAQRAAYMTASRVSAWAVASEAASDMITLVGLHLARPGEGQTWAELAEVALVHAGDATGLGEARRLGNLARVRDSEGALAEARALHERELAITERAVGPMHPDNAATLSNLASVRLAQGDPRAAVELGERALAIFTAALGPVHSDVAMVLGNLSSARWIAGDHAEAKRLAERTAAILGETLGPDNPAVATAIANLGTMHWASGEYAEALAAHGEALEIRERSYAPDHPEIAGSLDNLGSVRMAMGELTTARALYERALELRERAYGPDHLDVAATLANLAGARLRLGDPAAARELYTRALTIHERVLGREHPDVAYDVAGLADVALAGARHAEAASLAARALEILERSDGPAEELARCRFTLAEALWPAPADRERALALARAARDGYVALPGSEARVAEITAWLAAHAPQR